MRDYVIRMGLVVGMMGAAVAAAHAQEADFEWSGRMDEGSSLEVRGISGDVIATLAQGAMAEVVAVKSGRRSDFDDVEIEMFEDGGNVVVCVIYGSRRSNGSCREGRGGDDRDDHDGRNIRVSVDFEVRVPAGVEFIGSTVSGDVEAEGLRSDVDASTVSGDVSVSTTEVARGSTVSGSVDVEMGSLEWQSLAFSTVSGDIVVRLPAGVDTEVDFESLTGDLESDFDITIERQRDRFIGSELRGTIGDGGRRLSLTTVSGDVRIRRSRTAVR